MIDFGRLEATIRRDPAERGLATYRDANGHWLCPKHLERAATELARLRDGRILIVTGFCILTDDGPIAETDGPLGAIYLSDRLRQAGLDVVVASEEYGTRALEAGAAGAGLKEWKAMRFPSEGDLTRYGRIEMWREIIESERFTHLVAIERVGPSHDETSIGRDERDEFLSLVTPDDRGVCHNMRGISIDARTNPLHLLFECFQAPSDASRRPRSIGIVDGGNEIGCGAIAWSVLRKAIKQGPAERTACRVRTDSTIIAGVSNWGAYALGAALAAARGGSATVATWSRDRLRATLEKMVGDGVAVDGVTKRRETTVDGLPLETELAILDEIHAIALGA
jgi:hypothetical protein